MACIIYIGELPEGSRSERLSSIRGRRLHKPEFQASISLLNAPLYGKKSLPERISAFEASTSCFRIEQMEFLRCTILLKGPNYIRYQFGC